MPEPHEASTSTHTLDGQSGWNGRTDGANGFPSFPKHIFSSLNPNDHSSRSTAPLPPASATVPGGSSIDWTQEYARERLRKSLILATPGIRGVVVRLWVASKPWVVVVLTGMATGVIASCLDILSAWLSDLRLGACRDMWWMSRGLCCAGLDPQETCRAWRTWGEIVGDEKHVVLRALTQYSVYIAFAVAFALVSSAFVNMFAPFAFHTGIPEIKVLLGGYVMDGFLSPITLLIKSLGLPLAVASGLSLGKEGPLVHVACCIGDAMLRPFASLRDNGARHREILSAAAAAGVSVAFGAPLGGVLFSLEEISTFFPGSTLWQSFVCAIVAAVTLQYIDPFNTGKLALFTVHASQVWRGFELVPWLLLGIAGGIWGAWFIRLNEEWERLRRASGMRQWPITEVGVLALFTAVVSYLVIYMRIPSAELVVNLFQDCGGVDPYGLCDASNTSSIVFLLLLTAFAKTLLTAVTFGASIPAGIFLPSLTIGACAGRAVGLVMHQIQKANAESWIFADCPADGGCINPSVYAVIGAASALGGVTRMTISLVVILFELTGAIDIVLQLMMAVMVAKFTGDYISKEGIYETWINLRNYPFLNNKADYRRDTVLARHVMTPSHELACISDEGWTLSRLEALLDEHEYRGFPVVRTERDRLVLGYISRADLQDAIEHARRVVAVSPTTLCYFSAPDRRGRRARGEQIPIPLDPARASTTATFDLDLEASHRRRTPAAAAEERDEPTPGGTAAEPWISLVPWMDEIPVNLSQDTPMEVVVQMFQRLGLRFVLLTRRGMLAGLLTKMDLHRHIQGERDEERGSLFFPRSRQDEAEPRPSETPLMERGGHVEQGYR
ncbi:Anion/proton exchange transporter GEF1 [Rhodotorula toruloides]|uniref:Chloride channel protein n=1 Tax=Rhodotorula toruloides TaxID=5286 RepID=A0A0K3C6I8_RHOTO|nr:Anion/proton exchange transporter GEF1 [Rhodotorula toruloides]PRQ77678.1 Chloride channel [Rhodotorula toruloides]